MKRRDVDMLSGPIVPGLLAIAIPIMIMNVMQSLFNIIDMTILKAYDTGGGIAIGAVGSCGSVISMITGLVIGVSSGANVVIARNIGRRDQTSVNWAVDSAIAFSLLSGILLAAIGLVGAETFLTWVNCPERLFEQAVLYFRLYFAGVPILMLYNFCASILLATGDSRRPMIFLTAGGVVKVVFTFVFTAYFRLGVAGVAWATILSWGTSAVLGIRALVHNQGMVHLQPRKVRFHKAEMLTILRIGIPAGLQQVMYSMANVIIVATVNSFGPEATTGISIANNYDGILYQISCATALAVTPYVSQNIGRGNVKRASQSVLRGILITVCLGSFFGALSAIFSRNLASIMSNDPTVIAYARQKMIIISSTYFICGINEIMGGALRGMGKPIPPTICTFLYMCVLRFVWVYLIFPLCPTLTFLYLVWPVGWSLCIITLLFFYFPALKQHKNNPYGVRETPKEAQG